MREVSSSDRATRRWLVIAAVSVTVAVAVYLLAVWTRSGQQLENAALRGADQAGDRDSVEADGALGQITVYSLAAAVVVIALIGLVRRRPDLTIAAIGVIVAGQAVTQVLKRFVLVRPGLVPQSGHYSGNSLPSGHTTIAMTVLFAAMIVVPYRWRGVVLFFVLTWAVSIGGYTLTAKWHRLSDTLAADAISLALACVASWWLVRRGSVSAYEGPSKPFRVVFLVLCLLFVAVSLALGGILWGVPLARTGFDSVVGDDGWTVYLGATSLASAGSAVAALVFWGSWRRLDTRRPGDTVR